MDFHQASVNADVNINANTGTNTSSHTNSHTGTCFYRHIVSNANRKTDIGIDSNSNSSSEETDGKSGQPRESNTIWPSCKSRLLGDFGRKDCTGRDKGRSARESVERSTRKGQSVLHGIRKGKVPRFEFR